MTDRERSEGNREREGWNECHVLNVHNEADIQVT